MRALHRIGAGELPSTPVRAGHFALTRRAPPTIRRCRRLQTEQCGQLSDHAKCKPHILRPGRGTDVDRCDGTSLAILLPTPVGRVIVNSHSARVLSLRRRAASIPISYRLTPPYLILCADALRPYPGAVIPSQQSLHHHRNEGWRCAICRSFLLARPPSRIPPAPSPGQTSPVKECREKPQSYVADVVSGLPGMGWDIISWHDEETGLDRLTARPEQQLRPAPSALYGTLPGVWIALSGGKQSRSSSGRTSGPAVISGVPAGWSHGPCPTRWTGSTVESNDGPSRTQFAAFYSRFRLCGPAPCLPLSPFGDRACAPCLVQQPFVLSPRLPCCERESTTQPLLSRRLHLTTLEQHRGT
ncbi:hypothetical protein GA0061098_10395 [Bradyrhizobium shewense]|uniref:Uncharacterized protein n=1 Tax=Bradyrhizobium shewense TaxID=1761772 RepID=A0A1C3XSV3_9BRAD|nr:hypothetical protein GA0061098_10395 [Bradyrhizobium shewense]